MKAGVLTAGSAALRMKHFIAELLKWPGSLSGGFATGKKCNERFSGLAFPPFFLTLNILKDRFL